MINDHGMGDFWMSGGTVEGSFINNAITGNLNIANGSSIFANIHNAGAMGTLRIADIPGNATQVSGSIINEGSIENIELSGANVRVNGDIHNTINGQINRGIELREGATVGGTITNDGNASHITLDGSTIEESLINNGSVSEIAARNSSLIQGDMVNSYGEGSPEEEAFTHIGVLLVEDGATIDGQLINTGNSFAVVAINEATVNGNLENHGNIAFAVVGDGSTVGGSLINTGTADHLALFNNATITENLINSGMIMSGIGVENSVINGSLINSPEGQIETESDGIHINASIIGQNIENAGSISSDHGSGIDIENSTANGSVINNGIINAGRVGIQLKDNAAITGQLHNNELIEVGPGDGIAPANGLVRAGISLEGNSSVGTNTHGIFNHGTIRVQTGIEHDSEAFHEGAQANGIQVIDNADSGRIENHGQIIADTYGIYVSGTTIDGSIINYDSGLIKSGDNGIYLDDAHIKGSVTSSGHIISLHDNAIDFENAVVDSSVVVSFLTSHPDYDALSIDDSTIGGSVITQGPMGPLDSTMVTIQGEDGLDIDDTTITGSVISSGNIDAMDEGVDFDRTVINGAFVNTGIINAGRTGISIEGRYQEPEGEESFYSSSIGGVIGGVFDNSGTINAGKDGIDINRTQFGAAIRNHGVIHAETGSAITLSAITSKGSFYNAGNLTAGRQLEIVAETAIDEPFIPMEIEAAQRGISISGHYYDDGELELANHAEIGGIFENVGNISAYDEAIHLDNITVRGDFINRGELTSINSHGISFEEEVTIQGDFINENNITAGPEGSAIRIIDTIIQGDLKNYGTLTQLADDSDDFDENNHGLHINDTDIYGSILNYGNITVQGTEGILIEDSLIEGSVYNDASVTIDVYSDAILIDDSEIVHQLDDDGSIAIRGDVINHGTLIARNHDGIDINQTDIDGDIINTGAITSGDNAFELDGELDDGVTYMVVKGSLLNEGRLITREATEDKDRNGNGFDTDYVDIQTHLINTGDIDSIYHGFLIQKSKIGQHFANSGTLNVSQSGIVMKGAEIELDDSIEQHRVTVGSTFTNTGDITAGQHGILLDQVDINTESLAVEGEASFANTGDIDVTRGTAININDTSINGDFINTGDLTASELYSYQVGDSYIQDVTGDIPQVPDTPSDLNLEALGRDEQGNAWFKVQFDEDEGEFFAARLFDDNNEFTFDGVVLEFGQEIYINAGPITGEVTLTYGGGYPEELELPVLGTAIPSDEAFYPEYDPRNGMLITNSTVSGNFANSGNITSYHAGIAMEAVSIDGNFENTGNIITEHNGLELTRDITIGGNLVNEGNIVAGGSGIILSDADLAGFSNRGDIRSDLTGISLSESHIEGGFYNGGDITIGSNQGYQQGIYLSALDGVGSIVNQGDITFIDGAYGDGMLIMDVDMDGIVANTGSITASSGMLMFGSDGATGFINEGEINTLWPAMAVIDSSVDGDIGISAGGVLNTELIAGLYVIDAWNIDNLINEGSITVRDDDGITAIGSELDENIINTGSISAGRHGISLYELDASGVYNNGTITAGTYLEPEEEEAPVLMVEVESPGGIGNGIYLSDSALQGNIINDVDGNIQAATHGIYLEDTDGATNILNEGRIEVGSDGIKLTGSTLDRIEEDDDYNSGNIINYRAGVIIAGDDAIHISDSSLEGDIGNSGTITSGDDAVRISNNSTVEGNIANSGTITAGDDGIQIGENSTVKGDIGNFGTLSAQDDAIRLINSTVAGDIINSDTITADDDAIRMGGNSIVEGNISNSGTITATENAIDVDDSTLLGTIVNSGTITSGKVTVDIGGADSNTTSSVGDLRNSGTLTAENGAVIRVADSSFGRISNTGTLNGGQVSDGAQEDGRSIADGSTVALDFRTALAELDLYNGSESGNTGIINGDIYGSEYSDQIELAAGQLNGDIYDVETIDITGAITLNNDIFHFNNSSTLNVQESGTLAFGATDRISIEGDYAQDGTLSVVLNQNSRSLAEPVIEATGSATLNEGSTINLSVENRNIANFNPGFAGETVHLIHAGSGVTGDDNVSVASDSILFNYSTFSSNEGTEFGVIGAITDLGTLATSGGASANAVNAISTFQGENSGGLVDLYTSNPDLYNAIYNGTEASLTQLAEQLISGNPGNSIAASQNAQNDAINTILSRIADLRAGASGISAGDGKTAENYLRPDSLWIRAIYSDGDQKAMNGFGGYNLRSKGFTLGADKDVNDYLTLGLGMTMVTSTANQTSSGTSGNNGETDTYLGSLYAGWRNQDYFVDANLNIGSSKTDLSGAGWNTRFDSGQIAISALVGKSFLFDSNDSLLEPSIGVNFTKLKSDSYSYDATNIGETSLKTLELGAGVRYMTSFDVGSGQLLPEVSLMAWHDFKAEAVEAEIGFENAGGTFTYFGPEAVKNRYQASAGVEYWMDNNFTLSLDYDHNWQSGFKADTVQAKLRYDF